LTSDFSDHVDSFLGAVDEIIGVFVEVKILY